MEWFEPKIEMEDRPLEDIEEEIRSNPEWFEEYVPGQVFTMLTQKIAYDIATYFGEVIIYNNPKIYWGVETTSKSLVGVNWPRLMGFFDGKLSLWQYNLVEVCMHRSLEEKNNKRLYDLYGVWKSKIV